MSLRAAHPVPILILVLLIGLTLGTPRFAALDRAASTLFVPAGALETDAAPREDRQQQDVVTTLPSALPVVLTTLPPVLPVSLPSLPVVAAAPKPSGSMPWLTTMYVSFATLQVLDVHSTLGALKHGAYEANPMMASIAERPAALVAMKAGMTTGVIYMTERVRRKSPLAAVLMMAAFNSAYITVVAHNYRVVDQLDR